MKMFGLTKNYWKYKKRKSERTTAVWQYGGFGAFFETFVLVESSGIFNNFGAESRHIAKLQNVSGNRSRTA